MIIGSLIIQHQRIKDAVTGDLERSFVENLISLPVMVMTDISKGGRILDVAGTAMEAAVARFLEQSGDGMDNARQRLTRLVQPLTDKIQEKCALLAGLDDPVEVADFTRKLLKDISTMASALTPEYLRRLIGEFVEIIEDDLGLTSSFIEEQVLALIDDIAAKLEDVPEGIAEESRETSLVIATILRRIEKEAKGEFNIPRLNADQLAGWAMDSLRNLNISEIASRIDCISKNLEKAALGTKTLTDMVPYFSGFASGTLGAARRRTAEDNYCWYASWLLRYKKPERMKVGEVDEYFWSFLPIYQSFIKNDVWISKNGEKLMMGDESIHEGMDVFWTDHPIFNDSASGTYTFDKISADGMEKLTKNLSWIGDILVFILHLLPEVSIKKGDVCTHLFNGFEQLNSGSYKILFNKPYVYDGIKPNWLKWLLKILPTTAVYIGSLEGTHTKDHFGSWIRFQFTQTAGDTIKLLKYRGLIDAIQEFVLSVTTLINAKNSSSLNRFEAGGVVSPFVTFFTWVLIKSIPRKDYGILFPSSGHIRKMFLGWHLLGGAPAGLFGGFVGSIVAMYLSPGQTDAKVLGKMGLQSLIHSYIFFWFSLYIMKEGDTDNGRYNPKGPAFCGYPDHTDSPYRLPFEKNEARRCGQANQGLWSHNDLNFTSQVYSFDFGLDADEEILASRSGTVVDYFDWIADDIDPDLDQMNAAADAAAAITPAGTTKFLILNQTSFHSWNFIVIRHDRDDAGNVVANPDPKHDLDAGGTPVTTYGVYGHGRNGSVRSVFNAKGVAPKDIIGRPVKRGEPIMLAGDTGQSWHNHLHMMVQSYDPASSTPEPARGSAGAVQFSNLTNYTIPFVFGDVTNLIGTDGVPKALTYYTSENTRVP